MEGESVRVGVSEWLGILCFEGKWIYVIPLECTGVSNCLSVVENRLLLTRD